ncbi:hypothetical protein CC78DRAFT_566211 [Lojkania enalia]|uniref:Uncharacterized protein n=1 Tax=Lojkania enalia TaxID=147567 RepID=A0A9P4N6G7_9PLEO|nr:hypothetical protein CC78DRAFT_566211 [Didymosphaeria enalia]
MAMSSRSCSLLRLPRELRDMIYRYALSHYDGLFYHRVEDYKANFYSSEDAFYEFNQLKYACRQLYHETAGKELIRNDLIFVSRPDRKGKYLERPTGVQFLGFLDMCHEVWRQRIRRVWLRNYCKIEQDRGENPRDLHIIIDYCKIHPRTTVFWELSQINWLNCPAILISEGLHWETAFRGTELSSKCAKYKVAWIGGSQMVYTSLWRCWKSMGPRRGGREIEDINVPNFRFMPWGRDQFDEKKFRQSIDTQEPTLEDEIKKAWLELVREWYTVGM